MIKRAASAAAVAILSIAVLLASHAPPRAEAASLFVWNPADSGFGTFRWAVEQANYNSSINLIVLKNSIPITLYDEVEYWGSQDLTIQGDKPLAYRVIQGTGFNDNNEVTVQTDCSLFESTGGADLTFYQVTFQNSYCNGIEVYADSYYSDEVEVTLNKTILRNFGGSGLYLSEGGDYNSASFTLNMNNSRVENTGYYEYVAVEVSEYGDGDLTVNITGTAIVNNYYDGLHLDEEGYGSATLTASNSNFNGNGDNYMEAGVTAAEAEDAGDDEEEITAAGHSDGDGIDLNECDDGNLTVTLTTVQASGNGGDGVDLEECGYGNFSLTANGVTADGNGEDGLDTNENDSGNNVVRLTSVQTWNNGGEDDGVDVDESGDGNLDFQASGSSANMNEGDGYDLDEEDDGNLTATFSNCVANGNGSDGFEIDEGYYGSFMVALYNCTAMTNDDDAVDASADIETGTIIFNGSNLQGGIELDNVNTSP